MEALDRDWVFLPLILPPAAIQKKRASDNITPMKLNSAIRVSATRVSAISAIRVYRLNLQGDALAV